jgi:hypothetical protein
VCSDREREVWEPHTAVMSVLNFVPSPHPISLNGRRIYRKIHITDGPKTTRLFEQRRRGRDRLTREARERERDLSVISLRYQPLDSLVLSISPQAHSSSYEPSHSHQKSSAGPFDRDQNIV